MARKSAKSGRRKRGNRRYGSTLLVSARAKKQRGDKLKDVGRALVVIVAAAGAAAALWIGMSSAGGALFSRNDAFAIDSLVFNTEDAVVRDYFRRKFKIYEGANLFGFDIAEARSEFLRQSPNYRELEITRRLPHTLSITLHEREPLARFGRRGGFVIDREGVVFGPRSRYGVLPAIIGYRGDLLKPGDRVSGLVRDAVVLLDLCTEPAFAQEFEIRSIDVRGDFTARPDDLRVYMADDLTCDIWWARGPADLGKDDLRQRLLKLRAMIRQDRAEGRRLKSVDLTLDTYRKNTPLKYW